MTNLSTESNTSAAVYEIDGSRFASLSEFADHISTVLLSDYTWSGNLDAFNDVLRGGFGTPEEGFILRWRNAEISRQRLGYFETARYLRDRLSRAHSGKRERLTEALRAAEAKQGPTLFDTLVEIIREHGTGGSESEDNVELELR